MLDPKILIEFNKSSGGPGTLNREDLLHSAFSSYHYYIKPQEQISSIVRGVCKNHPFTDGNKRTSVMTFIVLSNICGLTSQIKSENVIFDTIIDIAANNYSVEKITSLLFKD